MGNIVKKQAGWKVNQAINLYRTMNREQRGTLKNKIEEIDAEGESDLETIYRKTFESTLGPLKKTSKKKV